MQYWTAEMEKQVGDRVQTVLGDPDLLAVFQEFGHESLRRSSVFHGLRKFLADQKVRGGTCFEIGTWNALTSVVLSRFFDQVITVDIAHNELKHKVLAHLGITNVKCIDIDDNNGKAVAARASFDFAYLDGNHADDTELDWALTRHCGRVLFHEAWPHQEKVWKLLHQLPREEVAWNGNGLALWTEAARERA